MVKFLCRLKVVFSEQWRGEERWSGLVLMLPTDVTVVEWWSGGVVYTEYTDWYS